MAKVFIQGLGWVDDPNAPPEVPGMPPMPAGPIDPTAAPAQVSSAPPAAAGGRGDGMYTPEERAWLYQKMPGINAAQVDVDEASALATELRRDPRAVRQRLHPVGQVESALRGFGDAYAQTEGKKRRGIVTEKYKELGEGWGGKGKLGPVNEEDYWDKRSYE